MRQIAIVPLKIIYPGFNAMKLQLKVPKIACSACVNTVTKAVSAVDPTAKVEADTKTKMVSIETHKSEAEIKNANLLRRRFANASAGYPAA